MMSSIPILRTDDQNIKQVMENLKLTSKEISKFWKVFRAHDKLGEGVISLNIFFIDILEESRSLFGDAIFSLVSLSNHGTAESVLKDHVDFGEVIYAVSTFVMFQLEEIVKIIFFIFDKERKGYIEKEAVEMILKDFHGNQIKGNVAATFRAIQFKEGRTITYYEFCEVCKEYPIILQPAFRIQRRMKTKFLGEKFWDKKIHKLNAEISSFHQVREKQRIAEERRLLGEWRRRIRSELGFIQYYFDKEKRENMERIYPKPIVYLSKDHDVEVKLPSPRYESYP